MASAYSNPYVYEPYVQQLPLDVIAAGLQYKQGKYDANWEKLQNFLSVFSDLDLIKPEDQEHFYNNLNALKSNVNRMGMGDLSLNGVTEQIASYIGYAADDKVLNGLAGTKVYRNIMSEAEWYKKNDLDSYNERNLAYSLRGIKNWMTDGKAGSSYKEYPNVSTSYIPHTDVFARATEVMDKMKPDITITPHPYREGEFYYFDKTEKIEEQDVINALNDLVYSDPQVAQQMAIDSWATKEQLETPELASEYNQYLGRTIKSYESNIANYKLKQKAYAPGSQMHKDFDAKIAENTKALANLRKDYNLPAEEFISYVDGNKERIALRLHQKNFTDGLVNVYAYEQDLDTNFYDFELERFKSKSKADSDNLDVKVKILEAWDEGNIRYADALAAETGLTSWFEGKKQNALSSASVPLDLDKKGDAVIQEYYNSAVTQMSNYEDIMETAQSELISEYGLSEDIFDDENEQNVKNALVAISPENQNMQALAFKYLEARQIHRNMRTAFTKTNEEVAAGIMKELIEAQESSVLPRHVSQALGLATFGIGERHGDVNFGNGLYGHLNDEGNKVIFTYDPTQAARMSAVETASAAAGVAAQKGPLTTKGPVRMTPSKLPGVLQKPIEFVGRKVTTPKFIQKLAQGKRIAKGIGMASRLRPTPLGVGMREMPILTEHEIDFTPEAITGYFGDVREEAVDFDRIYDPRTAAGSYFNEVAKESLEKNLGAYLQPSTSYDLGDDWVPQYFGEDIKNAIPKMGEYGTAEKITAYMKNIDALLETLQDPDTGASGELIFDADGSARLALRGLEGEVGVDAGWWKRTFRPRKVRAEEDEINIPLNLDQLPDDSNLKIQFNKYQQATRDRITGELLDRQRFDALESQNLNEARIDDYTMMPFIINFNDGTTQTYVPRLVYKRQNNSNDERFIKLYYEDAMHDADGNIISKAQNDRLKQRYRDATGSEGVRGRSLEMEATKYINTILERYIQQGLVRPDHYLYRSPYAYTTP